MAGRPVCDRRPPAPGAPVCRRPGARGRRRARAVCRDAVGARAIGEIGLDYHYDFSPRDVQQEVFRAQVRLARELRRPVVIHTREADEDTIAILREEGGGEVPGVLHCFTGGPSLARAGLDLGFYISLAGHHYVSEGRGAARDGARACRSTAC